MHKVSMVTLKETRYIVGWETMDEIGPIREDGSTF